MKRLILLGALVLVLAACGSSEEVVKEISVTREVEVTSVVEVTREVEVTRIVEVTKEVLVVATPTSVPVTPTPQAVIPDGWKTYQIISSGTTFAYPANWTILSELTSGIALENDSQYIRVEDMPDLNLGQDFTAQIQMLKLLFLSSSLVKDAQTTFDREGKLDSPQEPAYIAATLTFNAAKNNPVGSLITFATNGRRYAYILFSDINSQFVQDETIEMLTQLVRSMEFH